MKILDRISEMAWKFFVWTHSIFTQILYVHSFIIGIVLVMPCILLDFYLCQQTVNSLLLKTQYLLWLHYILVYTGYCLWRNWCCCPFFWLCGFLSVQYDLSRIMFLPFDCIFIFDEAPRRLSAPKLHADLQNIQPASSAPILRLVPLLLRD